MRPYSSGFGTRKARDTAFLAQLLKGRREFFARQVSRIESRFAADEVLDRLADLPIRLGTWFRETGALALRWIQHPPSRTRSQLRLARKWLRRRLPLLLVLALVVSAAVDEVRTSMFQSWLFSRYATRASYEVAPGPSSSIAFPAPDAPHDRRVGYSLLSEFQHRLKEAGFETVEQARFSPALLRLARWGVGLPYAEPFPAGLLIQGADQDTLYDAAPVDLALASYEGIPAPVARALLFIENKELESGSARRNPVIEWGRFLKGLLSYGATRLGLPLPLEGGSTLAVQLEKYRHSPSGRTGSGADKLRQVLAASVKVYREGPDTRDERRRIVLDYLNSMPLSAVPGYGEVQGLGEGLWAWYGLRLSEVVQRLAPEAPLPQRAHAFKHVLALLCAVRAPTTYLLRNPDALEQRVGFYTRRLQEAGVIEPELARAMDAIRLERSARDTRISAHRPLPGKAITAMRVHLQQMLGVPGLYELDRLHLAVQTTLDRELQASTQELLGQLGDSGFLAAHGLLGHRLLGSGDPAGVVYSVLLFERTPEGNALRVQADNLDHQLDLNDGMKLELGSTAKLRVLAHYLELLAGLWDEGRLLNDSSRLRVTGRASDPLTAWARETLRGQPGISREAFVELALDRRYSASPWETFFTGGGVHTFRNFDSTDSGRFLSVRDALVRSNNLVFIRMMRDLVQYHQARLPYDVDGILADPHHPDRRRLLEDIADRESRAALARAHARYQGKSGYQVLEQLLGNKSLSPRELAIFFYAAHGGGSADELGRWLLSRGLSLAPEEIGRLATAFGNPGLGIPDYGFLLDRHPLEVWAAVQALEDPWGSWEELLGRSEVARREAGAWLLRDGPSIRRAQDLRLRIRFEEEAFERMAPYWKRLGFPFERLVPSLATALGSSADRPAALAELMGILLNDGIRKPVRRIDAVTFAAGTPYHTVMAPFESAGERVMAPEVARAMKRVMAEVVERGTARRAAAAVMVDGRPAVIGGKTGSGDNRFQTFGPGGWVRSSRAINRTATLAFYIEDRYFGVITAFVPGADAESYEFTSSLPTAVFRLLAPALQRSLGSSNGELRIATRESRVPVPEPRTASPREERRGTD